MAEFEDVSIPKKRLEELEKRSDRLAALEAAGVDNWEGYGHAMAVLRGEADEDY
jgi:hypothetical protein